MDFDSLCARTGIGSHACEYVREGVYEAMIFILNPNTEVPMFYVLLNI